MKITIRTIILLGILFLSTVSFSEVTKTIDYRTGKKIEKYFNNGELIAQKIHKSKKRTKIEGSIPDGAVKTYENDKCVSKENYKNDVKDGLNIYYKKNERIEIQYLNGKKDGVSKIYNLAGNLVGIKNYKNDKLEGLTKTFDIDRDVEIIQNYKNNRLHGQERRYLKGKLIKEGYYRNGRKEGVFTEYNNEDGTVKLKKEFKKGRKVKTGYRNKINQPKPESFYALLKTLLILAILVLVTFIYRSFIKKLDKVWRYILSGGLIGAYLGLLFVYGDYKLLRLSELNRGIGAVSGFYVLGLFMFGFPWTSFLFRKTMHDGLNLLLMFWPMVVNGMIFGSIVYLIDKRKKTNQAENVS